MIDKSAGKVALFLVGLIIVLGGLSVLKGGLYIAKHEGDTFHLMQIVLRMADGQVPHLDFMTPIGALAFLPMSLLVQSGFGLGMAFIWSQVLTAILFLPIVLWVIATRLTPWVGALFGFIVLVLILALLHGESDFTISVSMHYNRLAWMQSFVAIVIALVPPKRPGTAVPDGVILGAMVSMMALTKMTYFVAFALPILVALCLTRQQRTLAVAVVTGATVAALVTLTFGIDYWLAYANDLLTVMRSEGRSAPGNSFADVLSAPAYLGVSVVWLASVVVLRQAKVNAAGLVLLLLGPGFIYVTYQNFGNDPQWLMLLTVLLLVFQQDVSAGENRFGWPYKNMLLALTVMAFAQILPSTVNLFQSPFRHFNTDTSKYAPILPRSEVHTDLYSTTRRLQRIDARVPVGGTRVGLPLYEGREPSPMLGEETLPVCSIEVGLGRYVDFITRDLENKGLAGEGRSVFVVDVFSSYWMFGDFEPLEHGAPWYYGGLPGITDADYLLVPLCPIYQSIQGQILDALNKELEGGFISLTEVERTDVYILYDIALHSNGSAR